MKVRSLGNYVPALRAGYGQAITVQLGRSGTLAASSSNELAAYRVPSSIVPDRTGAAARITHWFVHLASTGGTSGNTVVRLVRNGDTTNGILATATIAFNATSKFVEVDLRGLNGLGLMLQPGDRIGVYVTTIPGTASADLSTYVTMVISDIRG